MFLPLHWSSFTPAIISFQLEIFPLTFLVLQVCFWFVVFFFFLRGGCPWHAGQGLKLHHHSDNASSLICCTTRGLLCCSFNGEKFSPNLCIWISLYFVVFFEDYFHWTQNSAVRMHFSSGAFTIASNYLLVSIGAAAKSAVIRVIVLCIWCVFLLWLL